MSYDRKLCNGDNKRQMIAYQRLKDCLFTFFYFSNSLNAFWGLTNTDGGAILSTVPGG